MLDLSIAGKTMVTPSGTKGVMTGYRLDGKVAVCMPSGVFWITVDEKKH